MRMTALVPTSDRARTVVEELSLHGVDGGQIRVLTEDGQPIEGGERWIDRETDRRTVTRLFRRGVVGLFGGGALGFCLGVLVGWLAGGPDTGAILAVGGAGMAWGAAAGLLVGLLFNPVWARAWEDTHRPTTAPCCQVVVDGVPLDDVDEVRRVMQPHASDIRTDHGRPQH